MLTVKNLRRPGLGPLSFHIDGGECLALTGPSGAGKTLLLRALADLDLNEGEVVMGGRAGPRVGPPRPRVASERLQWAVDDPTPFLRHSQRDGILAPLNWYE